jgi:hypothetical protein
VKLRQISICLVLLGVSHAALAQQTPPPVDAALARPPGLEPVPDGPPDPPKGTITSAAEAQAHANDPAVTIRQDGANKIEEYRVHGKLYAIRVTPPVGPPYTMVDPDGNGAFVPASDPAGVSVHPPRWTLFEF